VYDGRRLLFANLQDLKEAIKNDWNDVTIETVGKSIEQLKNAVRKQNGGVIQRYDGDCWLRAGCRRKSERKCDIGATHCPMKFGTVTAELW